MRSKIAPAKLSHVWLLAGALLVLAVLLALGVGLGGRALAQGATVWVDPPASSVYPGQQFTVTVSIKDATDLRGYQFSMAFNPTVVNVLDVVDASFLGSTGRTVIPLGPDIDNGAGIVTFGAGSVGEMAGPNGDGDLAIITLEAVGYGDTALDLYNLSTSDTQANIEVPDDWDGLVHVVPNQVWVEPAESEVNRCDVFTVTVWVGSQAVDMQGYEFSMDWEPELFQVLDVVDTGWLGSTGRTVIPLGPDIDNVAGTLTFAAGTVGAVAGPDGPGPLAYVVIEAIGVGTSDLDLHDVTIFPGGAGQVPVTIDGTAEATKEAVAFEFDPIGDQVAGEPFTITIRALNEDGLVAVNYNGTATLADSTGTLAPTVATFENGVFTGPVSIIKAQENVTITAEAPNPCDGLITGVSDPFAVTHNVAVSVDVAPDDETVTAGECLSYTLTAEDDYGNIWDATAEATFTIDADAGGTWTDNVYCSEFAGTWTVTGELDGVSDETSLTVEHAEAVAVTIAPATAEVTAGDCVTYTLMAEDTYGNTWDVTAEATFSIDDGAGGTWTDNEYCSEFAGTWTVTGEYSGLSDDATLMVNPDTENPVAVTIAPATAEVNAGDCVTYTLTASDGYGNTWDVTAEATFSIDTDAGGTWTDNVYCSENAGTWTVTGEWSGLSDDATLTVIGPQYQIFLPFVARSYP